MMRRITEADRPALKALIHADPWHSNMKADLWYEYISFAVEDETGVTMYVALVPEPPAMRLIIQFCSHSKRVAASMLRYFPKVKAMLEKIGAERIVFDSESPKLIAFCEKHLGFKRIGETKDYEFVLRADAI